jgi:hypothetical protein
MIFWLVYLFFIGFLVVSAVVVFKADMSGPSKIIHILIAVMLVYGFYKRAGSGNLDRTISGISA